MGCDEGHRRVKIEYLEEKDPLDLEFLFKVLTLIEYSYLVVTENLSDDPTGHGILVSDH